MKCKYCGTNLAKNAEYCTYCGRFLGDAKSIEKQTAKKRRIWIGVGIVIVAIIFVFTTFGGNFLSQKVMNENLQQQTLHKTPTLGMTLEKFKDKYNNNNYAKKIGVTIAQPQIKSGTIENTFEYLISDKVLLTGVMNKTDNKLTNITVVGQPSDSQEDNTKFIGTLGIIIDTYSPDVPVNQRGEILKELGFRDDVDLSKANNIAIRGNVQYSFKFIEKTGFVFSVTTANQP